MVQSARVVLFLYHIQKKTHFFAFFCHFGLVVSFWCSNFVVEIGNPWLIYAVKNVMVAISPLPKNWKCFGDPTVVRFTELLIGGKEKKRSVNQPWSEAEHLIEKEKTHNRSQFVTRYSNVHFLHITKDSDISIMELCDYILLASQLSVKFKTFSREAIGLFGFMRYSRVREINKATFPCRSPIVVYESMATLLAHS